ncbi:hypothetical protein ACPSL3_09985 [Vibrio owensii]|uniref:hypothetical protein n=1 Tax=Vibrio owensii TaxID=696485 RepID=UPI003CE4D8CC
MGTVKLILETMPSIAKRSIEQYFEPLVSLVHLASQLRYKRSPSYSIASSELQKARDITKGMKWAEISTISDRVAVDAAHRASLRQAKINFYNMSGSGLSSDLYHRIISHNHNLARYIDLIEVTDIHELTNNDKLHSLNSTYSLLFLEHLHQDDFNSNYRDYVEVMSRANTVPIISSGVLAAIESIKEIHEVISVSPTDETDDQHVLYKAISLKIEEFISTVAGLRRSS